jgi:hypothetical protein
VFYHKGENLALMKTAIRILPLMAKIEQALLDILALRDHDDMTAKQKEDINSAIFNNLIQICYLFKSSDYSFEHEVRVIQYVDPSKPTTDIYMDASHHHRSYTPYPTKRCCHI